MVISGLAKLSMVDFPGLMCATVFTRGCNLRCPFCHNAGLVLPSLYDKSTDMEENELFDFLTSRKGILDGVCITGGEPLLYDDTIGLIERIKSVGFKVKLDTNGTFPDRLKRVLEDGFVDYVAMDIKNSPIRYAETVGIRGFDLAGVCESIELLKNSSVTYEFRTTVSRELHSSFDLLSIAKWLTGAENYFLQQYRETPGLIDEGFSAYSKEEIYSFAEEARKYIKNVGVRGI